jgi:hypothetical protein
VAPTDPKPFVAQLLSWSLGVAFGRFDARLATGERPSPPGASMMLRNSDFIATRS